MKPNFLRVFPLLLLACLFFAARPSQADSQARIARLSTVEGSVEIEPTGSTGWERALLNLPIVQGSVLRTGTDGRAEIEFEHGMVIRLVPGSELGFQTLGLTGSGQRIAALELRRGTAYFAVSRLHGDDFNVAFAGRTIAVKKPAHFRVELTPSGSEVAVLSGELSIPTPLRELKLNRGQQVAFTAASDSGSVGPMVVGLYDDWEQARERYHDNYYTGPAYASYPYYGSGDLNFYGTWYAVPDGALWRPFGVGYGWSPFGVGYWGWYPALGYAWVSPYPWGWLPYRYGSWVFVPGWGWGWRPGYWNRWVSVPRVVGSPAGFVLPVPPRVVVNQLSHPILPAAPPHLPANSLLESRSSALPSSMPPVKMVPLDRPPVTNWPAASSHAPGAMARPSGSTGVRSGEAARGAGSGAHFSGGGGGGHLH